MRLSGKIALVTGAASGIGAAIATRFVAEGAQVTFADINAEAGIALAAAHGTNARFQLLDVSSRNAWQTAITETEAAFGPLNILVNNAGLGSQAFVESVTEEDFNRILAINQTGTLLGMQTAIPSLRKGGKGSIINFSSLQGLEADTGLTAYVASKFGVRGITKSAALELGRDGIRANSIHPGMIRTPATGGEHLADDFFGQIPLRRRDFGNRGGYPEDVAGLAVFLASDAARYVTAAEFVIDGGKSVRFAANGANSRSFAGVV
jgi:3alpha(or 20beta)-hydroxysteroid dehydrogenase